VSFTATRWYRWANAEEGGLYRFRLEPGTYTFHAGIGDREFPGVVIPDVPSHTVELGR